MKIFEGCVCKICMEASVNTHFIRMISDEWMKWLSNESGFVQICLNIAD